MNLLLALPLLPLAVALWLAVSARAAPLGAGWPVALVAVFPIAVAVLVSPVRIELPELLVEGQAALVLDDTARAALLLFGGLWLSAGLLLTRTREAGPGGPALLVALSGAMALALAEGGPLVYAGLLATGYGLYAVMAGEPGAQWRRAGRMLIVLLVLSDLLVFELLLSVRASPGVPPGMGVLLLGLAAITLRGGVPPAHGWLPPALAGVGTPAAVLLAAAPTSAALFGALKLLPAGAPALAPAVMLFGLAGAAWAALVGIVQTEARATLGYAVAASAALLLLAVPAGAGPGGQLAWLGVALLGSCAALPLVALQHASWVRDAAIAASLLVHGFAGGQVANHAASQLPAMLLLLAPLAAVGATLLLTLAARRTPAVAPDDDTIEPTRLAFAPIAFGAIGLALAWHAQQPGFAALWAAPLGITLGLVLHRVVPARAHPGIVPGDLWLGIERAAGWMVRRLAAFCRGPLPAMRDRCWATLLGWWNGERWSRRLQRFDLQLRAWPATSLLMLVVALGAAFLLVQ